MKLENVRFSKIVQDFFMREYLYEPLTESLMNRIEDEIKELIKHEFKCDCECVCYKQHNNKLNICIKLDFNTGNEKMIRYTI